MHVLQCSESEHSIRYHLEAAGLLLNAEALELAVLIREGYRVPSLNIKD